MATRIAEKFAKLRVEGRKGFVPYLTAGDPDLATTEALLIALADAGADVIELGVPFSDPMADGPVIQRASERALQNPIGVAEILTLVERFRRQSEVPIVLFTYLNPLLQLKGDNRARMLRDAGVDGVLVTDLIPEEAEDFVREMRSADIDTIFLVAPTSTDDRIRLISQFTTGFVYVVARLGVTGVRDAVGQDVRSIVARVREYSSLPVAVGFGISTPEQVSEVLSYADAAVVGSRLVLEIERNLGAPDLVERIRRLSEDLRAPAAHASH
jgi:tryptophan synthase alpha chain